MIRKKSGGGCPPAAINQRTGALMKLCPGESRGGKLGCNNPVRPPFSPLLSLNPSKASRANESKRANKRGEGRGLISLEKA